MSNPEIINAETFEDHRGRLLFFNRFNMREVVRFYEISPKDTKIIRGWQGHRMEKKWFYCLNGTFVVNVIRIDDFDNPSNQLNPLKFVLNDKPSSLLHISEGYATAIKAMTNGAKLQVFSNFNLEASKKDDFRYPLKKWSADWQI